VYHRTQRQKIFGVQTHWLYLIAQRQKIFGAQPHWLYLIAQRQAWLPTERSARQLMIHPES